ncbi:large ribosomal subunit protein mL48-like [Styela clava]
MTSRISYTILRGICSRGLCTSAARLGFLPHDLLRSDMLSLSGLVKQKKVLRKKKQEQLAADESNAAYSYGPLNVSVEGYDMVVIEKFAQNIHRLLLQEKVDVREVYALPTEHLAVKQVGQKLTKEVQQMDRVAELPVHARVLQIQGLQSTLAPILLQTIACDIPPGVKLTVNKHTEEDRLKRYKPNKELEAEKLNLSKLLAAR